jgi:hypothetical protein
MANVDIEIYMTNFIGFFKKNPDQLKLLIGTIDSEIFYEEVRKLATNNFDSEKEIAPTRNQLISLLVSLNQDKKEDQIKKDIQPFMDHHMGKIFMN